MEFNIGVQFSREFSFTETSFLVDSLTQKLNECFLEKEYSSKIKKVYISFLCVSKGFEPYFMPRPLKILKKDLAMEYEIKLDYETVFKSNQDTRVKILYYEFLNQSKTILNDKKLIGFETQRFLEDLEKCIDTLI